MPAYVCLFMRYTPFECVATQPIQQKPSSNLYLYMYLVTFNVMHCIYHPGIFLSHLSLLLSRQIHILLYLTGVFYASSSEIWIFYGTLERAMTYIFKVISFMTLALLLTEYKCIEN